MTLAFRVHRIILSFCHPALYIPGIKFSKQCMIQQFSAKPPSVASRHLPPKREKEKHHGTGSLSPFRGRGPGRGGASTIVIELIPVERKRVLI